MDTRKPILFPDRFPGQLEDWSRQQKFEGKNGSQKEFARQVKARWLYRHPGIDENACPIKSPYVTDWKTGRNGIPYSYIPYIAEVLGVSPEVYYPTTQEEFYEKDSTFITKIGQKHVKFSNVIGLDLDLIQSLAKLVDFDTLFPLYSPIEHTTIDPDTGEEIYDRQVDFSKSAPIDDSLRFLQVDKDGKLITLHRCDLVFLKELQDQIVALTEGVLYHRAKQMDEETEAWNRDLEAEVLVDRKLLHGSDRIRYLKKYKDMMIKTFDSPEAFNEEWSSISKSFNDEGHDVEIKYKKPTPDFIREHDRFAQYNYVFPDRPKPKWLPIYEETTKATQEDIDYLLDGDSLKGTHTVKLDDGGVAIVKDGK